MNGITINCSQEVMAVTLEQANRIDFVVRDLLLRVFKRFKATYERDARWQAEKKKVVREREEAIRQNMRVIRQLKSDRDIIELIDETPELADICDWERWLIYGVRTPNLRPLNGGPR